jgi:pilus assembly protein FimV
LLIVLTAVLALIAFVIAWLLRRAAARREEDQDDLDEELYMSEIDEGAIDRRLEGINLDLDEPPKDDVARRPGVLRP